MGEDAETRIEFEQDKNSVSEVSEALDAIFWGTETRVFWKREKGTKILGN